MTTRSSSKRQAASRANGGKSRGPRTEAGKRAAAANARKHGLSQALSFPDDQLPPVVEAMARAFAKGDARRWPWAVEAALARYNLDRVRRTQQRALEQTIAHLAAQQPTLREAELAARAWIELAPTLRTWSGYARRYCAQAKRAFRTLEDLR